MYTKGTCSKKGECRTTAQHGKMKNDVKDLVQRVRNGEGDAFGELMDLHMQSMYKTAWAYLKNNEDAADAIQDTILTCYEKLHTLKKEKYFKTWLTRILINKCKDILRKKNRILLTDPFVGEAFIVPYEESGYADCEWKELLNALDEKYQEIMILYYGQGFKVAEIARLLDMNKNTVMTRISRARKLLEKEYQDNVIEIGGYKNGRKVV